MDLTPTPARRVAPCTPEERRAPPAPAPQAFGKGFHALVCKPLSVRDGYLYSKQDRPGDVRLRAAVAETHGVHESRVHIRSSAAVVLTNGLNRWGYSIRPEGA